MTWFYADDMLAWLQLDPNRTYVPVAELCERMGLGAAEEEARLAGHALLGGRSRRLLVDTDDGEAERLCLPVELVPLWLATLDNSRVAPPEARTRLDLFQRECASVLWQAFRPQGFDSGDDLVPGRHHQDPAEQAYVGTMAMANLARQQMLVERQLDRPGEADPADEEHGVQGGDPWAARAAALDDPAAARVAQTARRVARTLAERTRRNEYYGVFSGLYRNFSISSYRRMPPGRLYEAMEWLERWRGDLMGEPEPPPDI